MTLVAFRAHSEGFQGPINMVMLQGLIINPEYGIAPICLQGKIKFILFVKRTWKELVICTTEDIEAKPSIATFCRMDVGIHVNPLRRHPPAYFVNKVEQSLNTSLQSRFHGSTMVTLASTLTMVFQ